MYDIEELHDSGLMPDRYYNQLNGKSAFENYKRHIKKQQKRAQENRKKKDDESIFFQFIRDTLAETSKKALNDILKELSFR